MKARKEIKVAVIDMNNGSANLGMKGILNVLSRYATASKADLVPETFDLRSKNEIPGIEYDIYISSGGPGNPLDGKDEPWEKSFSNLLDTIEAHNAIHIAKKHVFLICYSFQLACRKYGIGKISRRRSGVFGIVPVSLTADGEQDILYRGLPNPFYAIDSREWQVTAPEKKLFPKKEAHVLAMENIIDPTGYDLERCIMSVRFSKEISGTQFHPEAAPADIRSYLLAKKNKEAVISTYGEEKYTDILHQLDNPNGITLTVQQILPNFITEALQSIPY